jgi:NitT/TauT family transport system permease protein
MMIIAFSIILLIYGLLFWLIIGRNRIAFQLLPKTKTKSNTGLSLIYWLSPLFFIGLWGLLASMGSPFLKNVPSPTEVAFSFINLLSSGQLPIEAFISFKRVVIGFTLACIIGIPIGLFAGTFLAVNHIVMPVNSFLRYIPPTAFIALLIVYFGVDETFKYAAIFMGVVFFIVQMVVDVVDDVDMRYIEMGITNVFSNWELFKKVIICFSWPRIFDVLRINLSASWTFLVAAELIGSERGLGHLIAVSQRFLRMGDLYVAILTFGIIGFFTDKIMEYLSRWLFRWYYVETRR